MGKHNNLSKLGLIEKSRTIIERGRNRQFFYEICLKLFVVCDIKNIRLIVENPYAQQHYLIGNFMYQANLIDRDRTRRGDYFRKPTQYWFLNCSPSYGFTEQNDKERLSIRKSKAGIKAGLCSEERSMISPDYARNFICDFIIGKEQIGSQLSIF